MRESKRRRLQANGWRIGSAPEFLCLSPEEVAFIEVKLRLADSLRHHRVRHHLTQAAKLLKSSQSRIAKMEAGDPSVSLDLMVRCLIGLGASAGDLARAIARNSPARAAV